MVAGDESSEIRNGCCYNDCGCLVLICVEKIICVEKRDVAHRPWQVCDICILESVARHNEQPSCHLLVCACFHAMCPCACAADIPAAVEVLDLDGNSLRGQIPNSLVNASDLTVLTAMGNQLTGELAGEGTGDWLGARVHDR